MLRWGSYIHTSDNYFEVEWGVSARDHQLRLLKPVMGRFFVCGVI